MLNNNSSLETSISQSTSRRIPIKQLDSQPNGKIHIRQQKGHFQRIRTCLNSLLVALFFLLPFLSYQGRQAILFDISEQQFLFFGTTLWPQDFTLLAWVLITAAFLLFFVTVFWGRVWCGYLCPQTAWTLMFVWIETYIEGSQQQRSALDKAPMSLQKARKRICKHLAWGVIALLTGCGFIAYFIPARELYVDILTFEASFWSAIWVGLFALCTYLNAGWMREQMCLHCCPYARFQSVMFDANTKTVTYNAARGESRGARKRDQETQLGDCVDCNLCVNVCPTGIDIRHGLQYECINCGACVDACNQTMSHFGYPLDLISYRSENQLAAQPVPFYKSYKFLGYGAAVAIMLSVIGFELVYRSTIELNVIRDRQTLYRETLNQSIENSFTLKIRNKTQQASYYQLSVSGNKSYQLADKTRVLINAGEQLNYPVTVLADINTLHKSRSDITFIVTQENTLHSQVTQNSSFFSP